jgi:hypothetical protein
VDGERFTNGLRKEMAGEYNLGKEETHLEERASVSGEELHCACTHTTFATSLASLARWQYSPDERLRALVDAVGHLSFPVLPTLYEQR